LNEKQKKTLNLEIIHQIGDFNRYIEKDNMSLFYLLFFCIYYRNFGMVDFIRTLIAKMPTN